MKKTIIAMAALAASGMAMAQVTVTGTLSIGYKATKAANTNAFTVPAAILGVATPVSAYSAGADASGLGVDTSQINFTAKEDLGGGQSVEASLSLAGADRSGESWSVNNNGLASPTGSNGPVTGRDAKLSYTNTSFGRIQLGSEEGGAVHSGIPTAGAPVIDMDGKLFQKKSSSDFISYAAQVGSWGFQYKLSESSKGSGLGAGSQGSAGVVVGQRTSDFILGYGSGALTGAVAYRTYDNRDKDSIATAMGLTKDNVVVLQLGYDAGVAKFGLGYQVAKASVGPQVQDVLVGVSKDLGAWTIGATYAMSTTSGAADTPTSAYPAPAALPVKAAWKAIMQQADGTATGYSLGAQYNFSKRTNVLVRYANWLRSGYEQFEAFGATSNPGEFGYGDRASETSILLVHNF